MDTVGGGVPLFRACSTNCTDRLRRAIDFVVTASTVPAFCALCARAFRRERFAYSGYAWGHGCYSHSRRFADGVAGPGGGAMGFGYWAFLANVKRCRLIWLSVKQFAGNLAVLLRRRENQPLKKFTNRRESRH